MRDITVELLKSAFFSMRKAYKKDPFLCESDDDLSKVYNTIKEGGYDQHSSSRILGSEYLFQSYYFKCLVEEVNKSVLEKTFGVGVELNINNHEKEVFQLEKKTDLFLYKKKSLKDLPLLVEGSKRNTKRYGYAKSKLLSGGIKALIELKQTGKYLTRENVKKGEQFKKEIDQYKNYFVDGKETLFLLVTYFEEDPKFIKKIINEYGSLLMMLLNKKKLEVSDNFKNNCIEAYAFRGTEKWIFIDNSKV